MSSKLRRGRRPGKSTKSEDARNELLKEETSQPSESILANETNNESKTSGLPKKRGSRKEINDLPTPNQISKIKRRQIRTPGSFSDIQNQVIGSVKVEDPRNSLFNFDRIKTPKPKVVKRLNFKKKQNAAKENLVANPPPPETPPPPVSSRLVKLPSAAAAAPPPPRPPSPLIPVETRETLPSIPPNSEKLDGGEPHASLRTLIHHPPKGPEAEGVRVADGVYVLNPQTLVPRVAVGYIIMDANTIVERQEKASCTSVYTVLSGKPTFVIANLGVYDTAMPRSLFTNVPVSILQLRANQDRAIISFSTVVANKL